jgi:hypothetical protein
MSRSAFVKLLGQEGLFSLTKAKVEKVRSHPQDTMCLLADAGEIVNLKDNSPLEDGIINANQTVLIKPNVSMTPSRYHALISYNPQISMAGVVLSPVTQIVRPGEEDMIGLIARASKKVDLAEFSHVFELYQID